MRLKKTLSLLMAGTLLAGSLLAGCGTTGTTAGSAAATTAAATTAAESKADETKAAETTAAAAADVKADLTFWSLSTRQEAIDPIVEAFQAENPNITVKVSYYDTDGIKDACKVAASSNTLPSMWFNWGGSLGGFYVQNGLTYDLTQYAKDNGWDKSFNPGALSLCTLSGQLAGYPTSYNVLGVYYRKDIYEKYGLKVPTTFEEFEKNCETLKANGITPISTAGLNGWHVMRFVELLIEHYAGAEMHDKMNAFEESYDNDKVVQALTKYKEFCDKGYFPEGFVTADPNDTALAVFSGEAAMDIQGQWYDGKIVQEEQDMNLYGVFSLPTEGTNRMSAFAEMTQFNKNLTPEQLAAGMKFMDYYYNEENSQKYAEYYNLPLPKIGAKMPEGQPNVAIMMDMSAQTGTFTITDQAFPTEIADGLFNVQDAIANGQMTPADGAKAIQKAIDDYKAK